MRFDDSGLENAIYRVVDFPGRDLFFFFFFAGVRGLRDRRLGGYELAGIMEKYGQSLSLERGKSCLFLRAVRMLVFSLFTCRICVEYMFATGDKLRGMRTHAAVWGGYTSLVGDRKKKTIEVSTHLVQLVLYYEGSGYHLRFMLSPQTGI